MEHSLPTPQHQSRSHAPNTPSSPFSWHAHYPAHVPHSLTVPEVAIHTLLRQSAKDYPQNIATEFFGSTLTYQELDTQVDKAAAALQVIGIKAGDRVALMLPNCPQMVICFFAVNRIGAVVVNVNPLYKARYLKHLLDDSGAKALITLDKVYEVFAEIANEVTVETVIVTRIQDALSATKATLLSLRERLKGEKTPPIEAAHALAYSEFLSLATAPATDTPIDPEGLALLQYTGGTTGLPKGTMLSHINIVSNVMMLRAWAPQIGPGKDCAVLAIPFFHVYGMTVGMLLCVSASAKMVLLPRFELKMVLKAIHKHRPGLFPGIPTMYVAINHYPHVSRYDLSSIHSCISGAAPLPPDVKHTFEALSGGRLIEGYGLTEASPVSHANPFSEAQRTGTIGFPLPSVEAKIVDEEGNSLPVGAVGELCLRGPNIMLGYWRNPEASARTLKDGWLYTGDMASMDEQGYFTIRDRKKDLIIAGGYNIYPREVEDVLYSHPNVQEAAVIGIPDSYRGETVKAFITLKDETQTSADDLIHYCREELAAYKVPKVVEFRAELPKSLIGKILRRELAEEERRPKA